MQPADRARAAALWPPCLRRLVPTRCPRDAAPQAAKAKLDEKAVEKKKAQGAEQEEVR